MERLMVSGDKAARNVRQEEEQHHQVEPRRRNEPGCLNSAGPGEFSLAATPQTDEIRGTVGAAKAFSFTNTDKKNRISH